MKSGLDYFWNGALLLIAVMLVGCGSNSLLTDVENRVAEAKSGGGEVAVPTMSPAPDSTGHFTSSVDFSVTIQCATRGATIHYTTDGSTPTVSTQAYTGPIAVTGNGTTKSVKAVATASGMTDSSLASATYSVNYSQVTTPTFSLASGLYASAPQTLTISSSPGATIRYTTDGSTPSSSNGAVYSSAISLTGTQKVMAFAQKVGMIDSGVGAASYTLPDATPVPSFPGGSYSASPALSLSTALPGATIWYTTDGTAPSSTNGKTYSHPFCLQGGGVTLRAVALASGWSDSAMAAATYSLPDVYVGGFCDSGGTTTAAGYWKNGTWIALTPLSIWGSWVSSLFWSGGDLYAGGVCRDASLGNVGGYWKNGTWVGLPPLIAHAPSNVTSFYVAGSDVYAGGYCNDGSSVQVPGYWKNGTWTSLSQLNTGAASAVNSIFVSGSDVYAGGFSGDSSPVKAPGYWMNGTWTPLPRLSVANESTVNSITVSGSDVYAAGYSATASGVWVAGYWKNGGWNALSTPTGSVYSNVTTLAVSGTDVYAGGYCSAFPNVGYWKNGTWNALSGTNGSSVTALLLLNGNIYAAGANRSSGVGIPGYWLNGVWVDLPPVIAGQDALAYSILVH